MAHPVYCEPCDVNHRFSRDEMEYMIYYLIENTDKVGDCLIETNFHAAYSPTVRPHIQGRQRSKDTQRASDQLWEGDAP